MPPTYAWVTFFLYFVALLVNIIEFYFPKVRSHGKDAFTEWWMNVQLFQEKYPDIPKYIIPRAARSVDRLFGSAPHLLTPRVAALTLILGMIPVLSLLLVPSQTTLSIYGRSEPFPERDVLAYLFFGVLLAIPSCLMCLVSILFCRQVARWLSGTFSLLKVTIVVLLACVVAYVLLVVLVIPFAILVPFWVMPYPPHEPPPEAYAIQFIDSTIGSVALYMGSLYITTACLPAIVIVLFSIGALALKGLQRPLFLVLSSTIEGLQRTKKWVVATLINAVVVIWTLYIYWGIAALGWR